MHEEKKDEEKQKITDPSFTHSTIFPKSILICSQKIKMWRLKCEFTIVIGILVLVSSSCKVNGMRFDIKTGATKCITDDIQSNSLSVGKFAIINPHEDYPLPDSHRITVRVSFFI